MANGAAALMLVMCAGAAAAAVQASLGPRDVTDAIAIGQNRQERERARFHAPYRLPVTRPPIDSIDVVTPFRRVVLVAESRASIGDRFFGQRQALDVLAPSANDLEILVELTFHPLNTYVGMPDSVIALQDQRGARMEAMAYERLPRYGPRVQGTPLPLPVPGGPALPDGSQPMLGGTVVARFDLRALDPVGVYEVSVEEAGTLLARVRADFSAMR